MPLAPALAQWLSRQGHDAVHANSIGLDRATDVEILVRAKRDARTIITADLDYPQLLAKAAADEPSVILFRDGNWSEVDTITRLIDVLAALSEADIAHSIIVVEKERIRRRRLPLKP